MGEVAAAVQEADLTQAPSVAPAEIPAPAQQFVPVEPETAPVPAATTQPETEPSQSAPPAANPETPSEQPTTTSSPLDLLAKLLRGEGARPDGS